MTDLLYQSSSNVIKECLWCFSNIVAGPGTHIIQFVNSEAFDRVLFLSESKNLDVRKESVHVISHSITGADVNLRGQIYNQSDCKVLKVMTDALNILDEKVILNSLEALECLFNLDDWLGY